MNHLKFKKDNSNELIIERNFFKRYISFKYQNNINLYIEEGQFLFHLYNFGIDNETKDLIYSLYPNIYNNETDSTEF